MRKPKAPQLVSVAIFTTITIVFWVFYSLYAILTSSPPLKVPPEILEPITPEIDSSALINLEGRIFFEEGQVETFIPPVELITPTPTIVPTITPTITPTATASPTLIPTPIEE